MPTFGSLFSGIGGLDLGLERAGWECRWQVEIDAWCRSILERHWPDVPKFGDVRALTGDELEQVDLVCGGFPCQPVSQNGHQLVQADKRWLWPEFARLLRHLRPRLVLVENVADLTVRGMGDVLGDLAACGFDAEWQVLPASSVGAPQRRERLYLVAYADRLGRQEGQGVFDGDAPQGLGESSPWGPLPSRSAGSRVRPTPDASLLGVADGFPTELDLARLRAVGNAVVPQVAEWIGRRLMEVAA